MFWIKIKAFFKYKHYRKQMLSKVFKISNLNIVRNIILIGIIFLLLIGVYILQNNSSTKEIFNFKDFVSFDGTGNKEILNQDKSDKDNKKYFNKNSKDKQNKITNNMISKEKYKVLLKKVKELKNKNKKLKNDNLSLQNTLRNAANIGEKPKNYKTPSRANRRSGVLRGKYLGEFSITSYTPSKEECGSNNGITASGYPIVPGVTVSVDTKYWPLGTVFYIKGIGYVVAMDTGHAIKGKNKLDFAVLSKNFANKFGRKRLQVYLIEKGDGSINKTNFKNL